MVKDHVLGFAMSKDRKRILLVQKNRPAWQAGLLNGIGGKIENFDVSPHAAMVREFTEEAGIKTNVEDWHKFATLSAESFHIHVFWSILDDFDSFISVTDEEIKAIPIKSLQIINFYGCISNLSWLINMLFDKDLSKLSADIKYL